MNILVSQNIPIYISPTGLQWMEWVCLLEYLASCYLQEWFSFFRIVCSILKGNCFLNEPSNLVMWFSFLIFEIMLNFFFNLRVIGCFSSVQEIFLRIFWKTGRWRAHWGSTGVPEECHHFLIPASRRDLHLWGIQIRIFPINFQYGSRCWYFPKW